MVIYESFTTQLCIVYMAIVTIYAAVRKKELIRFWAIYLLGYYVIFLLSYQFFPLPVVTDYEQVKDHLYIYAEPNNIIPFRRLYHLLQYHQMSDVISLGFDIMLLIPFGILVRLVFKKVKIAKQVVYFSLIPSIMIEGIQFLVGRAVGVNYCSVDIDDAICFMLGSVIGVMFEQFITNKVIYRLGRKRRKG